MIPVVEALAGLGSPAYALPAPLTRGPGGDRPRVQREELNLVVRPYEVMIILDPGLEEESIRAVLDRSVEAVRVNGGNPGRVDRWGKRRFAYEIGRRSEGYYALLEATAEPAAMAELDRMLSLADEVIRHKVIRLPAAAAGRGRPPAGGAPAPQGQSSPAAGSEANANGVER